MLMFTKTKKLGLAAVLVALCTAGAFGVASANDDQAGGDRKAEMLKKFDTNHDGKLDDAERQAMHAAMQAKWQARQQELLAKYDANRDGKLDDAEKQAMRHDLAAQRFAKLDTDGDGKLSLAEFEAGVKGRGFGHRFGRAGFGAGHGGFRHHGHRHGGGADGGNTPDGAPGGDSY
jgi:EF hand